MDQLVDEVCAKAGLDEATARSAIGIILSLVRSSGDPDKVSEVFAAMPGAGEFADRYGESAKSGGGLMGMLGGVMGGPMQAVSKLQAAGLDLDQIKQTGQAVLGHAERLAGKDAVRQVAGSIPGLSQYL